MTVKLVVVGSLNMDLVVTAPHIPRPGETVIDDMFRTAAGALAATEPGAQPSLPHLGAVRSLLESVEGKPAPGEGA